MNNLSLNIITCPDTENSASAAAIAHRHSQSHSTPTKMFEIWRHTGFDQQSNQTSFSNCIFGPKGVENVLSIEYTGEIFTLTAFTIYVDETTDIRETEYFIALKEPSSGSFANQDKSQTAADESFWEDIKAKLRPQLLKGRTISGRTARLLLSGSGANDPTLLNILQSSPIFSRQTYTFNGSTARYTYLIY
ncbi:hypothetical protein EAF04_010701 [Stromatinia cepivora]|nr:hypothetical protein EAF04_010701 [Stromatinia cepivora]